MDQPILLRDCNPAILCGICRGYLIEATTSTECHHTFCKSCIVRHLQDDENRCPICLVVVHPSNPVENLRFDRALQTVVYKLVPNLWENEENRKNEFQSKRLVYSAGLGILTSQNAAALKATEENKDDLNEEKISVKLVTNMNPVPDGLKWFRVPARVTILHVKKFISKKLYGDESRHNEIDVLCRSLYVKNSSTLKYIFIEKWKSMTEQFELEFRKKKMKRTCRNAPLRRGESAVK